MKKLVSLSIVLGLALLMPTLAGAAPIVISPGSPGVTSETFDPPNNCEPGCVEDEFGTSGLTLLYKAEVGGNDSGSFATSYNTVFANSASDPEDATISYVSGPSITCPECYLAIKDGNSNPTYYFYNLELWDGVSDIIMTGFWPGKGAISHVSIWGNPEEEGGAEEEGGGLEEEGGGVPEPASLLLFGVGVAATAARMRRRNN